LSLLEVLISTVVMGIALAGFLMALSTAMTTSTLASEENSLVYLASRELEALRSVNFDQVPFVLTGEPGSMQEVPNYFTDIAISNHPEIGGTVQVIASGDHVVDRVILGVPETYTYSRDYAFNGRGAEFNERWIGKANELAYEEEPEAGGPGGGGPSGDGPNAGGPDDGGPGADDDPFRPDAFQFIYGAFPEPVKVARILYDNRFNMSEEMGVQLGDFDYFPHDKDVWQRNFSIFWLDEPLGLGEILDPWNHDVNNLMFANDQGYNSTGVWEVFNNAEEPIELAILGVQNIDTYSDFDVDFHWPYVSEFVVYGFSEATNYVEIYDNDGIAQFNNVIMYFSDYLGSGYDLGRRVYVEQDPDTEYSAVTSDLISVELKFFPSTGANREEKWQRETWWQEDGNELARFETSFYRDTQTRIDRMPNLEDFPTHLVYDDNEDLEFSFTVPGASSIRGRFGTFNIEPPLGGPIEDDDHVTIKDKDGNIYAEVDGLGVPVPDYGTWPWTPWVTGDTIVIQFESNGSLNTYDTGYGGIQIDSVEVRWEGLPE